MEGALPDSMAIQECLHLLTTVAIVRAVTLYHQVAAGVAHITIRKTAPPPGQGPQEHYGWEARVTTRGQAWDHIGSQAYATAEAAYHAAVQAIQAAERDPRGEAPAGTS